jgi:3-oxoacyl-[acyl-carrier-protein] synthase-3
MSNRDRYAHVAGWGMYVPATRLTNHELTQRVETTDEWIRTRTGIVERRVAGEHETTASMATEAGLRALERAGVAPDDVDAIIVATVTGDYVTPSTACLVQAGLGAANAAAFDVSAGCAGFIYALALARMGIVSGQWNRVLVVGAETLSRFTDWSDRNTCVLFGDGAGALVLVAGEQPGGVLSTILHADGSGADLLLIPAGGSRLPASAETVSARQHSIRMDGPAVFRFATRVMPAAIEEVAQAAGMRLDEIDLVIPHQANVRIIESARKHLSLPEKAIFVNIDRYGNTSAASIPIALCQAVEEGRLTDGSRLVVVGFGAGLTWAAAALRWGVPRPARPLTGSARAWLRLRYLLGGLRMRLRRLLYSLLRFLPGGEE